MAKLNSSQILKIALATLTTSLLGGTAFHFGTESNPSVFDRIPATVNTLYSKWLQKYPKLALTPSEHLYRLKVFYKNFKLLKTLKKKYKKMKFGMNKFAGLTDEEFNVRIRPEAPLDPSFIEEGLQNAAYYDDIDAQMAHSGFGGYGLQEAEPTLQAMDDAPVGIIAPETRILDQGECGSCWAMSGATLLEVFLENRIQVSPKFFMDCRRNPFDCSNDKHAGNIMDVIYVLREIGFSADSLVPYSYKPEECKYQYAVGKGTIDHTIHNYTFSTDDKYPKGKHPLEGQRVSTQYLEKHLNQKRRFKVSVNISAPTGLKLYIGGPVYFKEMCTANTSNHAVVLAGHDRDNWIIQNSWGEDWGENGYFRVPKFDSSLPFNNENKNCICGGSNCSFDNLVYAKHK